jgi:hypothetical protein
LKLYITNPSLIFIFILIAMSDNPFTRAARAGKRPNYHQLNDGSDEEADISDRIPKRPYIASSSNSFETATAIPIE